MRPRSRPALVPDRRWIATVTFTDGERITGRITTTIYGPNCSEAERRYLQEHRDVRSVVVQHESIG